MTATVAIDARLVGYAAGIAQYVTRLTRALATLADGADDRGAEQYLVIDGRRTRGEIAIGPTMRQIRALTPPHHRLERWALPAELLARGLGTRGPSLLHSVDHVSPAWGPWRSVLTVHDLAFLRFPETHTAASRAYYAQVGPSARRAERVIAVSHSTGQDLTNLLGVDPARIRVVHEAAGADFFPRPRRDLHAVAGRLHINADVPYILAVGTLEPRKNFTLLLEAFARLTSDLAVQLLIVGAPGGHADDLLATHTRLRLGDRARFLGALPIADIAVLYSHAAVLAFPSLYEGFGLPPLEAMACGAPVVSSSAGPMPEVLGEAAILLASHDPQAWADALAQVLTDPTLAADLRARGTLRAARYSWERAARDTRAVYRQALFGGDV